MIGAREVVLARSLHGATEGPIEGGRQAAAEDRSVIAAEQLPVVAFERCPAPPDTAVHMNRNARRKLRRAFEMLAGKRLLVALRAAEQGRLRRGKPRHRNPER